MSDLRGLELRLNSLARALGAVSGRRIHDLVFTETSAPNNTFRWMSPERNGATVTRLFHSVNGGTVKRIRIFSDDTDHTLTWDIHRGNVIGGVVEDYPIIYSAVTTMNVKPWTSAFQNFTANVNTIRYFEMDVNIPLGSGQIYIKSKTTSGAAPETTIILEVHTH